MLLLINDGKTYQEITDFLGCAYRRVTYSLHRVSRGIKFTAPCLDRLRLKQLAYSTGQTVDQLNHGLLSNYLIQQLKRPVLTMTLV